MMTLKKIKNIINNAGDDINEDGEVTTDVYQLIFIGDDTTDSAYDTRFYIAITGRRCSFVPNG